MANGRISPCRGRRKRRAKSFENTQSREQQPHGGLLASAGFAGIRNKIIGSSCGASILFPCNFAISQDGPTEQLSRLAVTDRAIPVLPLFRLNS